MERAAELCRRDSSYFMPQQFNNPANAEVHRKTTAPELLRQLGDRGCDAFVSAVGTGGTISGVGAVLKGAMPKVKVIALEPATSAVLSGGPAGPHKIQGIGAGFVPQILDRSVIDEVRRVADRDAYETKVRLAKEEGLLVGHSSGASLAGGLRIAKRLCAAGQPGVVVTLFPDRAERYFEAPVVPKTKASAT